MEQLRQIGEAIGSLKVVMAFREEIKINRRQCCLLSDAFSLAFDVIVEEIRQHLKFDENKTKWKALENPLKELHRLIKEGEYYIKQCIEANGWWLKIIRLHLNTDCVEFHLHNLLWCLPVILEAIENVAETSGQDNETIQWKKVAFSKKYEQAWMERTLFFDRFAKHYLVSQQMCNLFNSVGKEDRWLHTEMVSELKTTIKLINHDSQLAELILAPRDKVHPSSVLVGSKDYQMGRRLGSGSQYKQIQWMGESFALYHCFCDINSMSAEISLRTSVMHPNVLNYINVFFDDERKELFAVMELMNKNLLRYINEISTPRTRSPLPLAVAVDIMLQIARGMEYLHSKELYHGELNPSNILVKSRAGYSSDGYMNVKITGFGQTSIKSSKESPRSSKQTDKCIWYAPEVFAGLQKPSPSQSAKFTEKADVYSFAMICFQLLGGKIPFEDDHLQGDLLGRNLKVGVRPLFPAPSPKYLTILIKKCWHEDPSQRPSFSSICRVLRYTKRFLIMTPEGGQSDYPNPPVEYLDVEMKLLKKFKEWTTAVSSKVSEIPFQMFCYRVLEREKTGMNITERSSDTVTEQTSVPGDEQMMTPEQALSQSSNLQRSLTQPQTQKMSPAKPEMKTSKPSVQKQKEKEKMPAHRLSRPQIPKSPKSPKSPKKSSEGSSQPTKKSPAPKSSLGPSSGPSSL